MLFFASLVFYLFGEPLYILLLLLILVITYLAALLMRPHHKVGFRRTILIFTIASDVLLLSAFKLAGNAVALPLGISFYLFQVISYLADVYRGTLSCETNFIRLGTYICMFPQLIAGPIVRYDEVRETLDNPKVSLEHLTEGLKLFSIGLFLKVWFADRLSLLWTALAGIGYDSISAPLAWMGAIGYSLQLYYDFYGYSLMALGLGKMLGFSLPENFDHPYMAVSIREFYRRWHMTLGRWFTSYVYIPLGGSRKGVLRTIRNLILVWLLTSLWHGFGVNYLIWGMSLCFFIILEKILQKALSGKGPCRNSFILSFLRHLYVLAIIVISWVVFALTDLTELSAYLKTLFGLGTQALVSSGKVWGLFTTYAPTLVLAILCATPLVSGFYKKWKHTLVVSLLTAVLFWLSVWYVAQNGDNPFLYFRF